MMSIEFEHNYQQKVMFQKFLPDSQLLTGQDVLEWRQQWTKELSSWHSPYKTLIDVSHLSLATDEKIQTALELMVRFFKGFFLRKISAYGFDSHKNHQVLPFQVFQTREEAELDLGVRLPKGKEVGDFRSSITLQNFFQQHCVELSFLTPTIIENDQQVKILKEKMTNNLMQWHSKWTLIVDCSNLKIQPSSFDSINRMLKFFNGLFMKKVVGYNPSSGNESYPFPVFRSRHKAVVDIEGEGQTGGDEADCRSRKTT
jgi:hypothetical protein